MRPHPLLSHQICQKLGMVITNIDDHLHIASLPSCNLTLLKEFLPHSLKSKPVFSTEISSEEFDFLCQILAFEEKLNQILQTIHAQEENAIANLLDFLLLHCIEKRASDIHLQSQDNGAWVRMRIDGILQELCTLEDSVFALLSSKIKLEASLDIHQNKISQDGRIQKSFQNQTYDFRISTLPTAKGESIVIRILDKQHSRLSLESLGLQPSLFTSLSQGLIFLTGPTGSGKSTTLYAILQSLASVEKKIITLEDPVEYDLDFLTQVNIHEGFGFSDALRGILRQDPDILMVGEIRDQETLDLAMRASLTGHLVLSTLHTNDSLSTLERLLDMGAKHYLVASLLRLVIAQRLVRKLCPHCKMISPHPIPSFVPKSYQTFYIPKGCPKCLYSGYQGRMMIYEILINTPELQTLIYQNQTKDRLKEYLCTQNFVSLLDDGLQKASQGLTSLEEVLRVTQ